MKTIHQTVKLTDSSTYNSAQKLHTKTKHTTNQRKLLKHRLKISYICKIYLKDSHLNNNNLYTFSSSKHSIIVTTRKQTCTCTVRLIPIQLPTNSYYHYMYLNFSTIFCQSQVKTCNGFQFIFARNFTNEVLYNVSRPWMI